MAEDGFKVINGIKEGKKVINHFKNKQIGMSLIELMIALLIGLLLSAAVITVYMSNKKTFWDTEAAASLQENAYFSLRVIREDLIHAGDYADGVAGDSINNINVPDFGSGCEYENSIKIDYSQTIFAISSSSDELPQCMKDKGDILAGTDVIFIKRTKKDPVTAFETNKTYLVKTGLLKTADHYIGAMGLENKADESGYKANAADGSGVYEFMYHIYYISKPAGHAFPQLRRMKLAVDSGASVWHIETVADGIEDIHFEFGIDATGDDIVDTYVTEGNVGSNWSEVRAVKMYLLAQSTKSDFTFVDEKKFTYRDPDAEATGDHYHRQLHETTIAIRNIQNN